MITPIENANDLAENKQEIMYGTLLGGSTMTFFRVSDGIFFHSFLPFFSFLLATYFHRVQIFRKSYRNYWKFQNILKNLNFVILLIQFFSCTGFQNWDLPKNVEVYGSKLF